jgi:hypothetical protein
LVSSSESVAPTHSETCPEHARAEEFVACTTCGTDVCEFCARSAGRGAGYCAACRRNYRRRKSTFFRARVIFLMTVLACVCLYGMNLQLRLRERNQWTRTLHVALVVVSQEPIDPTIMDDLRGRARVLEGQLAGEMARHRPAPFQPFEFAIAQLSRPAMDPPKLEGDGALDLLSYTYARWQWTRAVDRAAEIDTDVYDACVYLVVHPAKIGQQHFGEGASEQGGRVGIVEIDLDRSTIDWALIVSAHEALHTVGATDKYDAHGRPLPQGLPDPGSANGNAAEIMAPHRMVGAGAYEPIDSIKGLRVNRLTAAEIGWR